MLINSGSLRAKPYTAHLMKVITPSFSPPMIYLSNMQQSVKLFLYLKTILTKNTSSTKCDC